MGRSGPAWAVPGPDTKRVHTVCPSLPLNEPENGPVFPTPQPGVGLLGPGLGRLVHQITELVERFKARGLTDRTLLDPGLDVAGNPGVAQASQVGLEVAVRAGAGDFLLHVVVHHVGGPSQQVRAVQVLARLPCCSQIGQFRQSVRDRVLETVVHHRDTRLAAPVPGA